MYLWKLHLVGWHNWYTVWANTAEQARLKAEWYGHKVIAVFKN